MLVLFEPMLHTRPEGFYLDDPSYSRGKVMCYAKNLRDAYTTMIIEFAQLTPRDENNFAQLLVEAEGQLSFTGFYSLLRLF